MRLPDGTRPARRFRQSDPLRLLFDFVDAKACSGRRYQNLLICLSFWSGIVACGECRL